MKWRGLRQIERIEMDLHGNERRTTAGPSTSLRFAQDDNLECKG